MTSAFNFKNLDKWKIKTLLAIKVFITVGVLYYLNAKFRAISFSSFLDFKSVPAFTIAVILVPFNFFLQYKKWQLICDYSYPPQKKSSIFISILTGISTGLLTPGRLGEYPGRAFPLKDVKISEVTAGSAIDKLNSLMVILIAGSFSTLLFLNKFYSIDNNLTTSLLFLLTGIYLLLVYLILSPEFWRGFVGEQIGRVKIIEKYFLNFKSIGLFNRAIFGKNFLLSVLNYLVFSTQFVLLVMAYSSQAEFMTSFWGSSLVFFTKSIIPGVTLGEIGIRESASVYFLGHFGVEAVACFNAALMLYTINILIPAIPGAVFIFRRNK